LAVDRSSENNLQEYRTKATRARRRDFMQSGEITTIREHLERFRAVSLQCLERTPQEKLPWSPSTGLMTFAGQYAHLARVEQLYVRGLSGAGWRAEPNALEGPADIGQLRSTFLDVRAATLSWLDA